MLPKKKKKKENTFSATLNKIQIKWQIDTREIFPTPFGQMLWSYGDQRRIPIIRHKASGKRAGKCTYASDPEIGN